MAVTDKLLGTLMLLVAGLVFTYYTTWALLMPFLPPTHALQSAFPPREWAVRLPVLVLLVGVSAVGGFVGLVTWKEGKKRRAREMKRA